VARGKNDGPHLGHWRFAGLLEEALQRAGQASHVTRADAIHASSTATVSYFDKPSQLPGRTLRSRICAKMFSCG